MGRPPPSCPSSYSTIRRGRRGYSQPCPPSNLDQKENTPLGSQVLDNIDEAAYPEYSLPRYEEPFDNRTKAQYANISASQRAGQGDNEPIYAVFESSQVGSSCMDSVSGYRIPVQQLESSNTNSKELHYTPTT